MHNWKTILKTRVLSEAQLLAGLLNENDIPAQILNKQDSSYLVFGEIEVLVPDANLEAATQIISTTKGSE
ncbi:MAG: putative signal transducing protein [Chitinophagaceae bacterium]